MSFSSLKLLSNNPVRKDFSRCSVVNVMRTHRRCLNSLLAAVIGLWQIATPLSAATFVWDVDADGDTSLSSNWVGNVSPNGIGFGGDTINFTNTLTSAHLVTIDGAVTAGTLNIGDSTSTNAFTLASTSTGILIMDAASGSATISKALGADANDIISTNILFKDTLAITNASTVGSLTFSGGIRGLTSDITFNGAGAITVSTAAIITAGGLVKNDGGTTTLSIANTYAGSTIINGGTLKLNVAAALAARSAVTVEAGATLDYLNIANAIGSLSGAGTVTTSTASTTRILTIGRDDTNSTFSGQFLPATVARMAITKIGAGTLTLAPTLASTYTGNTVINGGKINLDFANTALTSLLAATPLQITGGDFTMTGKAGLAANQLLGALTIGATGGAITVVPGDASGTILRTGAVTATASGGTLLITAPLNTIVRLGTNYADVGTSSTTGLNNRMVFSDGTANTFNWVSNGGVAANDIVGFAPTEVLPTDAGGLATTAYLLTAGQTQTGATTIRSLKFSSSSAGTQTLDLDAFSMTLGGAATASPGAILIDGTDAWNINGTTGVLGQATVAGGDLIFQQYNTTAGVTVNAGIANGAGTLNVVKAGPGLLTLAGTNTFTGTIFVNGGILSFSNVAAGGAGSLGNGATTAVAIRDGATLQYTGATGTISGAATTAGAHTFTLQGGNANIEVTNSLAALSLNGVISGGGGFTKIGSGTLVLGGANTYSGPTYINAGTLTISAADRIPSTPLTVGASGTFDFTAGNETVGGLSGSGTILAGSTARTFTVGADNTSSTFTGTLTTNDFTTVRGHIFNKTGSGIQTIALAAPTKWSGSSNVSQGVIQLGNNNGMPSTGTWTIANSTSGPAGIDLNGFNWTTAGTNIGITFYGTSSNSSSQGSINIGTGTLTLNGTSGITVNLNGNPQQATIDATGVGGIVMTAQRNFDIRDSTAVPANRAELLINANISGSGGGIIKLGSGNLRIVGGTNTTTGTNRFDSGITWLDYSIDNTAKLGTGALDMRGGTLVIEGNASAATSETVASLTLASGGASTITVNSYGGQDASLFVGAITRAAGAGTIRFELPAGTQGATNGIITNTLNDPITGLLGNGAGFATVTDSTGTWFAKNSTNAAGGNIMKADTVVRDNIASWKSTENVTGSTGFTGTLGYVATVNSIRFNAPNVTSTVTLLDGGVLNIVSGGVLQTSSATGGSSVITGGTLRSSAGDELIFTADSDQVFNVASQLTGTTSLTKAGDGSLRLTGNDNYATDSTGNVKLFAGTLRVDGGTAIGDNAALTLSGTHSSIFELLASETIGTLSGGTSQTLGSSVNTLQTEIILNANTLTINQGAAGTFSGFFSGTGTLIKSGTAELVYSGNSSITFTGTVVINQGSLRLAGNSIGTIGSTVISINNSGSSLHINHDNNNGPDRVPNAAVITLNNTAPGLGLYFRDSNDSASHAESIGAISLGAGHNVVAANYTGNTSGRHGTLTISAASGSNLLRSNNATTLVVGRDLGGVAYGAVAAPGNSGRINFTNAITGVNGSVGGGGGDGTATASIFPYMIGQVTIGAPTASDVGNSFVRLSSQGLRPLSIMAADGEYTFEAAGYDGLSDTTANNLRFTATGTVAAAGAGTKTINALVIDSSAGEVTVTAPGTDTLALTSGALLSTGAAGNNTALTGFAGITTATNNEYIVFVTNDQFTLGSPLTTMAASLTKSGAGALILNGLGVGNSYTGGTYFNQGLVEASGLADLGPSGGLNFFGGGLRWATGSSFDISSRTVTVGTGGAIFDTNGNNITFANVIGSSGAGGLTKTGAGSLTLAAGAAYLGNTAVANGTLVINSGATMPSTGSLTLGSGSSSGVIQLGDSGSGTASLTVTELSTSGTGTTNAIVGGGGAGSVLTVSQVTTTTFAGNIGGANANENNLGITKTGIGSLTLSGTTLSYTGETVLSGGTLNITGSAAAALATSGITLARGTTLNLINTAGQAIDVVAGTLSLGASGTGTTVLGLELGSTSAYDRIITSGAASASGNVLFNLTGLSGFGVGNYDLLTAASGLDSATYFIGNLSGASLGGYSLSLTTDPTYVRLGVAAMTGDIYWQGGINASWVGNVGLSTNFTTDLAGTTNANGTPGADSTVIFSTSNNLQGPIVSTMLDTDFIINDLKFNSNPSGVTGVIIAAGTPTTSSLTIAPSSSMVGILVGDNAGDITISAPLVLGANQTWDISATSASLTITGAITGTAGFTKTGNGTVTQTNASSTYSGTTTINAGVLQAGIANGFGANSAYVVSSGGTLRLNDFSAAVGSLAGSGTVENGGATTSRTLTAGGDNTSTTFSGILQNGGAFTLGLTKAGTGILILSGSSSTLTGTVAVRSGVLQTTAAFDNVDAGNSVFGATNIGVSGGDVAMLYVSSGTYTTGTTTIGADGTGETNSGALVVNGGAYSTSGRNINLGGNTTNAGYNSITLKSGSIDTAYLDFRSTSTDSVGSLRIDGGTLTDTDYLLFRNGHWEFTVTGGTFDKSSSVNNIALGYSTSGTGTMTVTGGLVNNTGRDITVRQSANNPVANINLNGGQVITNSISVNNAAGTGILNFNGGTLTPGSNGGTLVNANVTKAYVNAAFGTFAGGVVIDTAGNNTTIAEALLAPTGKGVAGLTWSAGSGYIGAPVLEITTTSGPGSGATGYATVDLDPGSVTFGQITGVVLTNPGIDYDETSTFTINVYGGGGSGATFGVTGITLADLVSGGLTKNGAGILTLSGVNTYTGDTTINAGTLALGVANSLSNSTAVNIAGGTFNVATFNDTVASVILASGGTITGSTGQLTSTAGYDLRSGTVDFTGAGGFAGSGAVTKTTSGTVTLEDNGFGTTFVNEVNINGGTLAFSSSSQLGDGSATNTISINGGTLSLLTPTTVSLGATRGTVTIGSSGATFNTDFAAGVINLDGGITATSATSNLTKTGAGTVSVTGTTNLMGSAVFVSGGTLNAGFTDSISGITLSGGGALNLFDGTATTNNITTLNLGSGNALGFDLGAAGTPGSSDRLVLTTSDASLTGTLILNFTDIGGFGAGTYLLITDDGPGGLSTNPAADYTIGFAPTGLNLSLAASDANNLILTVSALNLVYWHGDVDGQWNTDSSGNTNWATSDTGTTDAPVPGASDTLVFSNTNATGPAISTTLEQNFTVDSLQFIAAPSGVTSVTIAQGGAGTLTLTPASSNNGISVADNAGAITISAPLVVGAAQTWEVVGTGANGSSLILSGDVAFSNAVTKTGAGMLTLSGNNTGAGGLLLTAGSLTINSVTALGTGTFTIEAGTSIDNSTGGLITLTSNNIQNWNGSFTYLGTTSQSLDLGTGAVTLGNNLTSVVNSGSLIVGGVIGDGASTYTLIKAGAGTLVLNGNNTYNGLTYLFTGTLTLAGDNSAATGGVQVDAGATLNIANNTAGTTNALGTGTLTINGGILDNTSGSAITANAWNNLQAWNGNFTFTGTHDLNLGTGAVTLGANTTVTTSAGILTAGAVGDGASTFNLTKAGTGTLVLGGVSSYDGATTIGAGTLKFSSGTQLLTSATNTLVFGASAGSSTVSSLDLTVASATFGGTTSVQTNSASANTISIGSGQKLQLNGAGTIGYNSSGVTTTKLTVTGLGTLSIGDSSTPTNSGVTIGGNVTTNVSNKVTLDLSGLSSFYANLGTGTFRVGDATNSGGGAGTGGGGSALILATDSTILATTITSDSPTDNVTQVIKLGSGTNVLWANTITIGLSSNRGDGTLDFNTGTGTLQIRNLAGTGRATMNVANGASTSGAAGFGTVDFTGHSADLLLGTLTVGGRSAGSGATGNATGTFSFDTGTLDASTVVIATRTGTTQTTSDVTGTLNLMQSGGTGTVTIATLNMGVNSVSTSTTNGQSIATLNIGGSGTVGITTLTMVNNSIGGGATAQTDAPVTSIVNISGSTTTISTLNMNTNSSANTGTGNASLSTLNISGGVLNVGTGSGTALNMANASNAAATATSTITITGGTLTMNGNLAYTAGSGTENTTLTLNGGTLDMGGFNIGAILTQVGSGSGSLNFQSGTLKNLNELNGGADFTKTTAGTLILEGTNGYTGATNISAGTLQVGSGGMTGTLGVNTGDIANEGVLAVNRSDAFAIANNITGAGGFTQMGSGTTTLTGASTFAGNTTVSGGVLQLGDGGASGSLSSGSAISVASGTVFAVNQSDVVIQGTDFSSAAISGAGGFTQSGTGTTVFNAANTYSGATSVTAGTLQVGDGTSGSLTGTGTVTVSNTGSKLSGSGSIAGGTIIGSVAILAPGVGNTDSNNQALTFTAVGTAVEVQNGGQIQLGLTSTAQIDGSFDWTVNDALTYLDGNGGTSGAAYISTWSQSGDYDSIKLTDGTFTLGSTAGGTIKLIDSGTTAYSLGQIFKLLDWSTVGTANSLAGGGTFTLSDLDISGVNLGGLAFDTSAFTTYGLVVIVPEPARALLLMLGFLGLMMRRRRLA